MDNQSINTIRFNANMILSTSRATSATLPNYPYLLNPRKRIDAIASNIGHDFENEPCAVIVANSIHKAISNLIPIVPVIDFDYDGEGEDLHILVNKAYAILQSCDEDGLAVNLVDKFNTFLRMMEVHEQLELEWLWLLAND